jgi:hypothetical protein
MKKEKTTPENNTEFQDRSSIVLEMLLSGLSQSEIIANIKNPKGLNWTATDKQINEYITNAQSNIQNPTDELKQRYELLYKKLLNVKDYKNAITANNKLADLIKPEKPIDNRIGNQFWKIRSKHGREKLFETPEILWTAASEYFQWCDDNQLIEVDFKGKDADRVELPKMRAYTWDGLELYLDIYSLRDYKTNESYKDFSQVITRIEKIIYNQKFTGAAAGFLNPNIIARDLGLADKSDIKHSGGIKVGKDLEDENYN